MKSISALFSNIYNSKKLLLVFIFSASVFLSFTYLFLFKDIGPAGHRIPGSDYLLTYKPFAENILNGKGITRDLIEVPPGYPFILSVIFGLSRIFGIDDLELIVFFNIVISALSSCLLFLIANYLFNRKVALIAALLWLSYPFNVWLIKNPNTEVPFILLLYTIVYFYLCASKKINIKYNLAIGILIGIASLVRPIAILLSLPLILLTFFLRDIPRKSKYLFILFLIAGNVLAVFPWEVYVKSRIGDVVPLSTLGPSAVKIGLTFALRSGESGEKVIVPEDVKRLMEKINAEDFSNTYNAALFLGKEFINNPVAFAKLIGIKMARAWYATSQKWYESQILLVQFFYLLTAVLGAICGFKTYKNRIWQILVLLSIILYFWFMTVMAHSILRYMIPAMGLVIIFSAIFIDFCLIRLKIRWPYSDR